MGGPPLQELALMSTRPGREADQFMLRLPPGMRERIRTQADARGRSMNAEIVAALADIYPEPADPLAQTWEHLDTLARQIRDGTVVLPTPQAREAAGFDQEALHFEGGIPELLTLLSHLVPTDAPVDNDGSS